MTENYRRGRRYSWVLNRFLYQDILHDAFVNYHKSTGENLFDQPIKTVIRTIKLTFFGYYISQRYVRNRNVFASYDDHLQTTITPEDLLIGQEELENLVIQIKEAYPRTATQMIQILNMKLEGYNQREIAEELGVGEPLISYQTKKIRKMQINSPFNGSRLKMKTKITRKHYDAHPEKYGEFVYDPERGCDSNEFYTETVNPEGEYLLIREKGD